MKRHNTRIIAIMSLYNIDLNKYNYEEALECFQTIKNLEEDYEYQVEIEYDYSEQMIKGVLENIESIDNIISNSLVKYTIDRLSYVDRAIIRLATYEMKFLNLAKEVAIDEALLITREYSSLENDAQVKFNNKLLDNISKVIYE
jgi:N utilization substance protein B